MDRVNERGEFCSAPAQISYILHPTLYTDPYYRQSSPLILRSTLARSFRGEHEHALVQTILVRIQSFMFAVGLLILRRCKDLFFFARFVGVNPSSESRAESCSDTEHG